MVKLEFTTERSKATPVVKHEFSKLYLHDNYVEVMLNYDFHTKRSRQDVEYLEVGLFIPMTWKKGPGRKSCQRCTML